MYKWIIVTYQVLINDCLMCSCLLSCEQLVKRENKLVLYTARPYGPENVPGNARQDFMEWVYPPYCVTTEYLCRHFVTTEVVHVHISLG